MKEHGEGMEREGGEKETKQTERTDTLLSLGVNKRDLSSQTALGPWETLVVCVFETVQQT